MLVIKVYNLPIMRSVYNLPIINQCTTYLLSVSIQFTYYQSVYNLPIISQYTTYLLSISIQLTYYQSVYNLPIISQCTTYLLSVSIQLTYSQPVNIVGKIHTNTFVFNGIVTWLRSFAEFINAILTLSIHVMSRFLLWSSPTFSIKLQAKHFVAFRSCCFCASTSKTVEPQRQVSFTVARLWVKFVSISE